MEQSHPELTRRQRKEAREKRRERRRKKERTRHIWRIVGRTLLFVFTVLFILIGGVYAMLNVVFRGPSQTAGDRLTLTLLETSAGKFVPYLYYSAEEVAAIQERNKVVELEQATDTSLITVAAARRAEQDEAVGPAGVLEEGRQDILVEEVKGATYHGWMMTVLDPSRVIVGVSADYFSEDRGGMRLGDMAEKYEAVAAVNGGAFSDHNGQGNGGMPSGVTVTEGRMTNAHGGVDLTTVGFDGNDVLIVGKMTRVQAEEKGIRDAVSFGPALVVNGEPAQFSGVSSGLNPRTAIGQRADGAVLMLVIDGRQVNSPGASMADLVEIMVRYGAVNACNLDGGSSSNIYYEGEILNDGVAITGSRRIPTAFIVR
ncbi:MAG: phosphodiester glycosidase family protein [Clostridia bacterium]|nr:phosphodiester glycosidase family protein [Clostridia bacterium]